MRGRAAAPAGRSRLRVSRRGLLRWRVLLALLVAGQAVYFLAHTPLISLRAPRAKGSGSAKEAATEQETGAQAGAGTLQGDQRRASADVTHATAGGSGAKWSDRSSLHARSTQALRLGDADSDPALKARAMKLRSGDNRAKAAFDTNGGLMGDADSNPELHIRGRGLHAKDTHSNTALDAHGRLMGDADSNPALHARARGLHAGEAHLNTALDANGVLRGDADSNPGLHEPARRMQAGDTHVNALNGLHVGDADSNPGLHARARGLHGGESHSRSPHNAQVGMATTSGKPALLVPLAQMHDTGPVKLAESQGGVASLGGMQGSAGRDQLARTALRGIQTTGAGAVQGGRVHGALQSSGQVVDPTLRLALRRMEQEAATERQQKAGWAALDRTNRQFLLDMRLREHERADEAREAMRKGLYQKLKEVREGKFKGETREWLTDWERNDKLFTPGWKREGARLRRELRAARRNESKQVVELWQRTGRRVLENSPVVRAMRATNQQPPRNVKQFPKLAPDSVPIVLSIRNLTGSVHLCLEALSRVIGIQETLLIISYESAEPHEAESIVRLSAFCQTKDVTNPYSPRFHASAFPGLSQDDCKPDDPRNEGCKGQRDSAGHYRDPSLVVSKLHWWWTLNMVWSSLQETAARDGYILFIDEDTFLEPHAYRQLQHLIAAKGAACPACAGVQLDSPAHGNGQGQEKGQVQGQAQGQARGQGQGQEKQAAEQQGVSSGKSAEDGAGQGHFVVAPVGHLAFAFNRTTWQQLQELAEDFCFFDDHRWLASATEALSLAPAMDPRALAWSVPLAHSIAGCLGQPATSRKCSFFQPGAGAREDQLVVPNAEISIVPGGLSREEHVGIGGFGDGRDQGLCLSFGKIEK